MRNVFLFFSLCLLSACTGQKANQSVAGGRIDSSGIALNTSGINRSIPPPIHRNHPQGSVGMGAPDQVGTAAITELNQDQVLNNLPGNEEDKPATARNTAPFSARQFIMEAYELNLRETYFAKQISKESNVYSSASALLKNNTVMNTRLKQLAAKQGKIDLSGKAAPANLSAGKGNEHQQIIQTIKEKIALYEKASVLEDTAISAFARAQIPVLKQQLADWAKL